MYNIYKIFKKKIEYLKVCSKMMRLRRYLNGTLNKYETTKMQM